MLSRLHPLLTPALLLVSAIVITVAGASADSNPGVILGASFLVATGVALKQALSTLT